MSTADEIRMRIAAGQPAIAAMHRAMSEMLSNVTNTVYPTVCAHIKSTKPHRGKRARRAAFYARQRQERWLNKAIAVVLGSDQAEFERDFQRACAETTIYGIGWVQVPHDRLMRT